MRVSSRQHQRYGKLSSGFTLVELLVAMALTVFLLALFSSLFVSATGGVTSMRGIGEADQKVRNTVNVVRKDLQNVYLANGGVQRTPAQIFGGVDLLGGPDEGYFTIEENSPASPYPWSASPGSLYYRQGIDQAGIPVEIDVDDVMAFTARLPGINAQTYYYGRVPRGSDLDNILSPRARFDVPNNGLSTSQFAEIVYFLRPDKRQYTLSEVNQPDAPPVVPATYTLYRRQLLLLTESQRQFLETKTTGTPAAQLTFPQREMASGRLNLTGSYYQHYDVSAYWDNISGGAAQLRFNDLTTVTRRRNRFGMIPQATGATIPPPATEDRELPFVPVFGGGAAYSTGRHDPTNANDLWFGRPTLHETTHNAFPWSNPSTIALTDTNANAVADAYDSDTVTQNRRSGEDVLLTNVVSFDIKVYDDDFTSGLAPPGGYPAGPTYILPTLVNRRNWPAFRTAPGSLTQTIVVNPARDPSGLAASMFRPEFVDLGYLGVREPNSTNDLAPTEPPFQYVPGPAPATFVEYGRHRPAAWRSTGRPELAFGAAAALNPVSTYDTWCENYRSPDSTDTLRRVAPYERPLRGIQIKIRVLEPKSNIVREFTIVHQFDD